MKLRYRITVRGDVQGAGYRAAIQRTARKMKITGYVENLEDGDVRIVAEGERTALEAFKKAVRIRGEHVNVEAMRTRKGKATGEFKGFRVKVADLASEMFQGYATAERYFSSLGSDVRAVGEKVDKVGEKVDKVGEKVDKVGEKVDGVGEKVDKVGEKVDGVGRKVDVLTEHTDANFASLDGKYDSISAILRSMHENSAVMQREFIRTREELSRVVDSLVTLVREGGGGRERKDST